MDTNETPTSSNRMAQYSKYELVVVFCVKLCTSPFYIQRESENFVQLSLKNLVTIYNYVPCKIEKKNMVFHLNFAMIMHI